MSEYIDDETLAELSSLTEHDKVPTKLELDRFIKSQGYVLIRKGDIYWTREQLSAPDWSAKYYKEKYETN